MVAAAFVEICCPVIVRTSAGKGSTAGISSGERFLVFLMTGARTGSRRMSVRRAFANCCGVMGSLEFKRNAGRDEGARRCLFWRGAAVVIGMPQGYERQRWPTATGGRTSGTSSRTASARTSRGSRAGRDPPCLIVALAGHRHRGFVPRAAALRTVAVGAGAGTRAAGVAAPTHAAAAIHRDRALGGLTARLLTAALVAGDPALATRVTRLFTRPLVRSALLMRGLAALAGDLALLSPIHRRKSSVFFRHDASSPVTTGWSSKCNGCAC